MAGCDEALVDDEVGADAGVDVVDGDVVLAGVLAAEVLVLGVFLVAASGVAVEGEEGFFGVVDGEVVVLEVFDDVGAAEVAGGSDVDGEVDDGVDGDGFFGVCGEDGLDEGLLHFVVSPQGKRWFGSEVIGWWYENVMVSGLVFLS